MEKRFGIIAPRSSSIQRKKAAKMAAFFIE